MAEAFIATWNEIDRERMRAKIWLEMEGRQMKLMIEALDTACGALVAEMDSCSGNGDDEGAELRWEDAKLLESLIHVLCLADMRMNGEIICATIDDDSAAAEAPPQDAASCGCGSPQASPASSSPAASDRRGEEDGAEEVKRC